MRYTRYEIVLQQNSLPDVRVVIVAPLAYIDDGSGNIGDLWG
jgi:hypothetical protein